LERPSARLGVNTESPAPVFLGYRPKVRHPPDGLLEWLGTAGVVPVSDCLCGHPDPEWIQRWDFNRAGCYATVDAAWASVPEDRRADSEVLALWLLPARFVDGALRDVRIEDLFGDDLPPLPDADPDVRGGCWGGTWWRTMARAPSASDARPCPATAWRRTTR